MCFFFWVVNASRNEKSCLQFLIPTAVFHMLLRRCETLSSAREIASMALSAEQARHTENVFHIALRQGSTSSLSHSHEPYGVASVAPMRFCCVLSLALRGAIYVATSKIRFFFF